MSELQQHNEPWNETWSDEGIKDWNDKVIKEFRENNGKVGGPYENGELLLLTTTGATSGKRRTSPLAFLRKGDDIVITGGAHNPSWYFNLKAHPQVTVELGTETFACTAIATSGEEREQLWQWVLEVNPYAMEFQKKAAGPLPLVILKRS